MPYAAFYYNMDTRVARLPHWNFSSESPVGPTIWNYEFTDTIGHFLNLDDLGTAYELCYIMILSTRKVWCSEL